MPKKQKFNRLNFSYFFSVSFLSLFSIFIFLLVLIPSSSFEAKKLPQQLPVEEAEKRGLDTFFQTKNFIAPPDFFQEINFGETKTGEIILTDLANPFSDGGHVDGYCLTLPEIDSLANVEVSFWAESFKGIIYILNSDLEKIGEAEDRVDFTKIPLTNNKVYCLLVGTDYSSPNGTGSYKITFGYK